MNNKLFESSAAIFISDNPWSAAFISFVYKLADPNFPTDHGHTGYAQSLRSNTEWSILNPKETLLKPGDIVVRNRAGNELTFDSRIYKGKSHGDIVTAITNDRATVIGGNLSNTVKENRLRLDQGKLESSDYFVVLRPKNQSVADKAVKSVIDELKIWEENNWTEKDMECYSRLQLYYNSVDKKIPGVPESDIDFKSSKPITQDVVKEVEPQIQQPTTTDKFGTESVKVYSKSPDPYIYCVKDGIWYAKEGPDDKKGSWEYFNEWTSLEKNCKAIDILDTRHPGARTPEEIERNYKQHCQNITSDDKNREEWIKSIGGDTSSDLVTQTDDSSEDDDDIIVF